MSIKDLTRISTSVSSSDLLAVGSSANGDDRAAAISLLQAYMQDNLIFTGQYTTQYSAPSSDGFTVVVGTGLTSGYGNVHLILTPAAGYPSGTVQLPLNTTLSDKQEVIVNCTQSVTTFTVDGNGATVTGEPTGLSANDFFTLKYDTISNVWYRIA